MKFTELHIGKLLLIGVLISASVVLLGSILYLYQEGSEYFVSSTFKELYFDHNIKLIIFDGFHYNPSSIILLGLGILFVVQLLRVALTACFFISNKEIIFFWLSIFVLLMLILSISKNLW